MPISILKPAPEPSSNPESPLRLPAKRRMTLETSQRLSTITEAGNSNATPNNVPPPKIPPRSILRNSIATFASSNRTAPPSYKSYEWVSESLEDGENGHVPVEGEKLARLRREGEERKGGWGRVALVAIVVLLVLALAIGLGVGLTSGGKKHDENGQVSTAPQPGGTSQDPAPQPFPLGEYSVVTALRTVQTDCTSNAATWRCYPYSVYDPASTADTTSRTTFNWVLTNTSAIFASNSTALTSADGTPANLTISSTTNPFSISFANETMTYISATDNTTSPRLTFSFQMSKNVVPSPAITPDGTQSECFFNSTTFTGTLYLSAERDYPLGDAAEDAGIGGYKQWPYAAEIVQSSPGGQSSPTCYETDNGGARDGIVVGLEPQNEDTECACRYSNY